MKNIDVLWLIEHVARELDVACAVKAIAELRYGIHIEIYNFYADADEILKQFNPKIVIHPFFYFLKGAMGTETYVHTWPDALHFNLAWEELFYPAHEKIKAPSDEYTKKKVIHHAWGEFYRDFLVKNGVPTEHIIINGHPAYQLYLDPYNKYFFNKEWLSKKYNLNRAAKWIFIPENYRWAFLGNKIEFMVNRGGNRKEIQSLIENSKESLKLLLIWCNRIGAKKNVNIIFRPRPSTYSFELNQFFSDNIGEKSPNLFFIKDETVRDWILASEIIVSSYSTSLIEGAIAKKPIFIAEPIPIPPSLRYDWYENVEILRTYEAFEQICDHDSFFKNDHPLNIWAMTRMLSNGDPISGLAEIIYGLLSDKKGPSEFEIDHKAPHFLDYKGIFRKAMEYFDPGTDPLQQKIYWNKKSHENDNITQYDIQQRVRKWKEIIK